MTDTKHHKVATLKWARKRRLCTDRLISKAKALTVRIADAALLHSTTAWPTHSVEGPFKRLSGQGKG